VHIWVLAKKHIALLKFTTIVRQKITRINQIERESNNEGIDQLFDTVKMWEWFFFSCSAHKYTALVSKSNSRQLVPLKGLVLHVLLVILEHGAVGPGDMSLCMNAVCAVARQGISRHAAVDDTLARQTGDICDTIEGSAVLADR
jgi:hypothetical protein